MGIFTRPWDTEVVTSLPATAPLTRPDNVIHVRRLALLRYRDFRSLVLGQVVGQSADAAATVLLASIVLFSGDGGPSISRLIWLVATSAFPLVVAGPLGGVVADRFTRRRILVIGQLARSVLVASMLVMILLDRAGFVFLAWGAGLCVARILYTSRAASLRHLVRDHELVAADSLSLTVGSIAGALGGSLGVALAAGARSSGLAVVAVVHLISAVIFSSINSNIGGGRDHRPAGWHDTLERVREPKMRYAILATSSHRLFSGAVLAAVLLIGDSRANGSAVSYTAGIGACGIGTFIGSNTAEWVNEHFPRRSLTYLVFTASALVSSAMVLTHRSVIHLGGLAIVAFLFQNLRVCSDATVQSNAVSGSGGRAFALYDISYNLCFLVGILTGLSLFGAVGGSAVIMVSAVGLAILAGAFAMMPRERTVESRVDRHDSLRTAA